MINRETSKAGMNRFLISTLYFLLLMALTPLVSAQSVSVTTSSSANGWGKGGKPKPTPTPNLDPDWIGTGAAGAGQSWNVGTNWSSGTVPNGAGTIVDYKPTVASGTAMITNEDVPGGVTVGTISLLGTAAQGWSITSTTPLTLNNSGAGALISNEDTAVSAGTTYRLTISQSAAANAIVLADNLTIKNTSGSTNPNGSISIQAAINGTGNITIENVSNDPTHGQIVLAPTTNSGFSGSTTIKSGAVTFNSARSFGLTTNAVNLGVTNGGSATLLGTAAVTLANPITVASSGSGTFVLGASASTTFSGTITLNGSVSLTSTSGSNVTFSNVVSGTGGVTKTDTGTVTFSGSSANTYTGKTLVSSGTLILNKTGVNAISSTGASGADATNTDVQVTGGTIQWSASNQIVNTAKVGLSGGTLNLNGKSEGAATSNGTSTTGIAAGVGALTLSSTSTIDFGAGDNANKLVFSGLGTHTAGAVLQITNWNGIAFTGSGSEQLIFAGATTDFTSTYTQTEVSFNSILGYAAVDLGGGFYEITAIPEPSTWAAAALAAAVIGYQLLVIRRRRLQRA